MSEKTLTKYEKTIEYMADCRCGNFDQDTVDAAIRAAVEEEREACAKLLETIDCSYSPAVMAGLAEAIRARGGRD